MNLGIRSVFVIGLTILTVIPHRSAAWADESVLLSTGLDEGGRLLRLEAGRTLEGVYYPTDELDHDKPEITRPDRYRVEGRFGRALRFFEGARSYADLSAYSLDRPHNTLVISLFIKTHRSRTSVLLSNKSDSATSGFAVLSRLNHLHFQYGDGQEKYVAVSDRASISDGQWHWVRVEFDQGRVRFFIDNESYGEHLLAGKTIAPGASPLTLGNYPLPGRGREMYGFAGDIDELVIATKSAAVDQYMQDIADRAGESAETLLEKTIFDATCQPVDGNESHFDGKRLFHSFAGKPVPLSFLFKGNAQDVESASLVLYVPENVVCREVFSSNHNLPDEVVPIDEASVIRDGITYRRYETRGFNLADDLRKTYSVMLTAALDSVSGQAQDAEIHWGFVVNGREVAKAPFTLRFLDPLADTEPGRFRVMNYFLANGMAFHDPALQHEVASLFLSSGMSAKGRFYSHDRRRVRFDNDLQDQGFLLYNISLWQGPFSKQVAGLIKAGVVRPAINPEGQPDPQHPCPTDALRNDAFHAAYDDIVRNKLSAARDDEWVVYDFEPWGLPTSACFCEVTLRDFKDKFNIAGSLTPQQIKSEYREQWTQFWVDMTTEMTRMWTQAVHRVNPTLKISEYTYIFDYDAPDLNERFYEIPKDPRRISAYVDEYMLSIYNFHGRNLFDSLEQNQRVLEKPITPIALLSRPHELMSFTTPAGSLPPQQMYQRTVLVASLGCSRMALYPGKWVDGMYHREIGRACRLIWTYEKFFQQGTRCDDVVSVVAENSENARGNSAHVVWREGEEYILVLYNFDSVEMSFSIDLQELPSSITIVRDSDGHGYDPTSPFAVTVKPNDLLLLHMIP